MHPASRILAGAVLLFGAATLTQGASADQIATNAALLEKYFADVNDRDLAALKDAIADNYVQHGAYRGTGLPAWKRPSSTTS